MLFYETEEKGREKKYLLLKSYVSDIMYANYSVPMEHTNTFLFQN